jgi:hypothetical protein
MWRSIFSLWVVIVAFEGCSVTPTSITPQRVESLANAFDANISQAQRYSLSKAIYTEVASLTKAYQLTSPPYYHNFLVTIGMRQSGLCYHWSDALYLALYPKHPSFDFHLVGANIGSYWREHNALLVVAKGKSIEEGIIIDPWRNSGRLFWTKIGEDRAYAWEYRPVRSLKLHLYGR